MNNQTDRQLFLGFLSSRTDASNIEFVRAVVETWARTRDGSLIHALTGLTNMNGDDLKILEHLVELHLIDNAEVLTTIQSDGKVDPHRDEVCTIVETLVSNVDDPSRTIFNELPPTQVESSVHRDFVAKTIQGTDDDTDRTRVDESVTNTLETVQGVIPTFLPCTLTGEGSRPQAFESALPLSRTTRFRRIRSFAKGGLGEVFLAEDCEVRREVALKEIQEHHADHQLSRNRFLLEAEVTGKLEHPGIVPIYGMGQYPDGRPFYAMRFIRGHSLKEIIDEYHKNTTLSSRDRTLKLRELLGRLISVCNAIHFAHSKGVIHRDLKPANIMIGSYGETLVVDWGLAKVIGSREAEEVGGEIVLSSSELSDSTETIEGSAMGTPQYMSPEQAEGHWSIVGVSSDIYSLGATLYSLLTGKAPFVDNNVMRILAAVRAGDFPSPRQVVPSVPQPLDRICLKAMALKPENRFVSARALADDIERWLADEPVEAFREPLPARILRWGRHHMPLVTGVAALLITVLLGLVLTTGVISAARNREATQKRLALENFDIAKDGTDGLLDGVADVDLAEFPEMEPVRRDLLDRAKKNYSRFLEQRSTDPLVRWGVGRASTKLGDIERILGHSPVAEAAYARAIVTLDELSKEFPTVPEYRRELASAHHGLGILRKTLNRFADAETSFRTAIALRQNSPTAANPDEVETLAESRYFLGAVLAKTGARRPEDEALYLDAINAQQTLVNQLVGDARKREKLARYLNNLAILQSSTGRTEEALGTLYKGITIYDGVDELTFGKPGSQWQSARLNNNAAAILINRPDRVKETGDRLTEARKSLHDLATSHPLIPQYRQELASVFSNIGLFEEKQRHRVEAIAAYRSAIDLLDKLIKESADVPDYWQKHAVALLDLSILLYDSEPAAASKAITQAIAEQESLVAAYPNVADYENALGRSLYQVGTSAPIRTRAAEARRYLESAIQHHQAVVRERPENQQFKGYLADDRIELSNTLRTAGELDAAATAAEQVPRAQEDSPLLYFHAAALLVKCAEAARASGVNSEAFEARAVNQIRDALRHKLLFPMKDLNVPDLKLLQDREDFHHIKEEIENGLSPKNG